MLVSIVPFVLFIYCILATSVKVPPLAPVPPLGSPDPSNLHCNNSVVLRASVPPLRFLPPQVNAEVTLVLLSCATAAVPFEPLITVKVLLLLLLTYISSSSTLIVCPAAIELALVTSIAVSEVSTASAHVVKALPVPTAFTVKASTRNSCKKDLSALAPCFVAKYSSIASV